MDIIGMFLGALIGFMGPILWFFIKVVLAIMALAALGAWVGSNE